MTDHRKPCFPPLYNRDAIQGICIWCSEALPLRKDGGINQSRLYHKGKCREAYSFATSPSATQSILYGRDGGAWVANCAGCGGPSRGEMKRVEAAPGVYYGWRWRWENLLEVDHIIPLWLVDRNDPLAWTYWQRENLQLLCSTCHKSKSAREAACRAKTKRIMAQGGLLKKKVSKRERVMEKVLAK